MQTHRAPTLSGADQKRVSAHSQQYIKLRDAAKTLSDPGIAADALKIIERARFIAYCDCTDAADPEWIGLFQGDISRALAGSPELHHFFAAHGIEASTPLNDRPPQPRLTRAPPSGSRV